jgi:hypothetical protein
MKPAAFLLEIVAFIIHDQLDDGALGQIRWFIEYQSAFLDACSKPAHINQFTACASTRQGDTVTGSQSTQEQRRSPVCADRTAPGSL